MGFKVVILLFLGATWTQCTFGQSLGDLVGETFKNDGAEASQPAVSERTSDNPLDCTCVPYYQCQNGTVIENGVGLIDIRIKEGPCSSYLDVCCQKPIADRVTPPVQRKGGCGPRHPDGVGFRITGDSNNEAQFGEFPWMVAILREETLGESPEKLNVYKCGGALIHEKVVLTAAHCIADNTKEIKIRAGEWDTQTKNELFQHQDRTVTKVVIHPEFHSEALYNDIALLILDSPVNLTDNVDVICLPKQDEVLDHSQCLASGWGKDVFGKEGRYQVILKKVELPIVPREKCLEALRKTRLGNYFKLHESFICAGGDPGKDTCKGDGGSPLVCPLANDPSRYQQAGIVAWGIGCGDGTPGVYGNVAAFRNWIDDQMSLNHLDSSSYSY